MLPESLRDSSREKARMGFGGGDYGSLYGLQRRFCVKWVHYDAVPAGAVFVMLILFYKKATSSRSG